MSKLAVLLMKKLLIFWALCSLVGNSLGERSLLIEQVTFLSTNFDNILIWENNNLPPGTMYDVQYKRYGDSIWQNKSQCQNITQKFCNLTQETENVTEAYYGRVRAISHNCCVSQWIESPRFWPMEDTKIGAPNAKYIPSVRSIKFWIQPPDTPLRDEDNQLLTVEDIFSKFGAVQYDVTIFCPQMQQKWVKSDKEFEISNLIPDTEYNGTIYLQYSEKKSKPHVFRVRTLPDVTWLLYLFGVVAFMTVVLFATIYYLIYKYIKRPAKQQPASLDFKGISHFQPLTLTVEQILTPYNLPKSTQMVAEIQPVQIKHPVQEVGDHTRAFHPSEITYQQQAKVSSFKTVVLPLGQVHDLPVGYAPQAIKNNQLDALDDKPLTLTYGICVKGANKTNSPSKQEVKSNSLPQGSITEGCYQAQKSKPLERLWKDKAQRDPPALNDAAHSQHLLLLGNTQDTPQQQLEDRVHPPVTERTGSYRKQLMELLPPPLEMDQNATLEGSCLSSVPPSSFSGYACKGLSEGHRMGQWGAWNSFACHPLGFPMTDDITQASEGWKGESASFGATSDTSDSTQENELLTGLFRDLELKLQWDHGADEPTAIY